jgi:hypothetical protein
MLFKEPTVQNYWTLQTEVLLFFLSPRETPTYSTKEAPAFFSFLAHCS